MESGRVRKIFFRNLTSQVGWALGTGQEDFFRNFTSQVGSGPRGFLTSLDYREILTVPLGYVRVFVGPRGLGALLGIVRRLMAGRNLNRNKMVSSQNSLTSVRLFISI